MRPPGDRKRSELPAFIVVLVRLLVRPPHSDYLLAELHDYNRHQVSLGRTRFRVWLATVIQALLSIGRVAARPRLSRLAEFPGDIARDLKFAARSLFRSPVLLVISVLTLGAGIGAATVVFSVVDAALITPLPYRDADRIVAVWGQRTISKETGLRLRESSRSLTELSLYHTSMLTLVGETARPERLTGLSVLPSHFGVLGVTPELGRGFIEHESQPGSPRSAILSYALWQRAFRGDSTVVGRSVSIEGQSVTVVGVMGSGHVPVVAGVQLWVPMIIDRGDYSDFTGVAQSSVVGRLAPSVSLESANSELRLFAELVRSEEPGSYGDDFVSEANVKQLRSEMVGEEARALRVLSMAVVLVLLISCANVSNLLLARASRRHSEAALRRALGAGTARLIMQFMNENLLLGLLGGLSGFGVAATAVGLVRAQLPTSFPMRDLVQVDTSLLGFSIAVAILSTVLFGIVPSVRASRGPLLDGLRESSQRTAGGGSGIALSRVLVVVEIALAVVLVAGAGLLLRSTMEMLATDPGFDESRVLTMQVSLPDNSYTEPGSRTRFFEDLNDRVRAIPSIESAGMVTFLPMAGITPSSHYVAEGEDRAVDAPPRSANFQMVLGDYFSTMSIGLVEGRLIDRSDAVGNELVGVINESLAHQAFPDESALGRRITLFGGGAEFTVVGVVEDVRQQRPGVESVPEAYLSYRQLDFWPALFLTVRTGVEPLSVAEEVRSSVWEIDSDVPVARVATMETVVREANRSMSLITNLISAFAVLALLLAGAGVYGVLDYAGSLRKREYGIRSALGEARGRLIARAILSGLVPVALGAGIGTIAALASARLISGLVYGIPARDPITLVLVVGVIGVVSLMAAAVPALRATRPDLRGLLAGG